MKHAMRIFLLAAALIPAIAHAQYDYNDDFTKAVAVHYPPLIRLLVTKGATQNTQDTRGDTPLMLAIRSGDSEITELLMHYQPDLSMLNTRNHSAATEAVLADDADSLKDVLVRSDPLQVAESIGLAMKLQKRRALNRFAEILGTPDTIDIGRFFLKSPLMYFEVGSQVAYPFSPATPLPQVCGKPASHLLLQGKICKVDGEHIEVEWQRLSNLDNDDPDCSPYRHLHWARKTDSEWNARFLGTCGVPPRYFANVAPSFDYRRFIIPELK